MMCTHLPRLCWPPLQAAGEPCPVLYTGMRYPGPHDHLIAHNPSATWSKNCRTLATQARPETLSSQPPHPTTGTRSTPCYAKIRKQKPEHRPPQNSPHLRCSEPHLLGKLKSTISASPVDRNRPRSHTSTSRTPRRPPQPPNRNIPSRTGISAPIRTFVPRVCSEQRHYPRITAILTHLSKMSSLRQPHSCPHPRIYSTKHTQSRPPPGKTNQPFYHQGAQGSSRQNRWSQSAKSFSRKTRPTPCLSGFGLSTCPQVRLWEQPGASPAPSLPRCSAAKARPPRERTMCPPGMEASKPGPITTKLIARHHQLHCSSSELLLHCPPVSQSPTSGRPPPRHLLARGMRKPSLRLPLLDTWSELMTK